MSENSIPGDGEKKAQLQRENNDSVIGASSRRRVLGLFGSVGLGGLVGCTSDSEGDSEKSATIAIPSSVTRDGADTHGVIPYWTRVIEPLTWPDHELNVEPWLAEDWEQIDELTWEFYLREDVSFHNGEPLNAEAVMFSLRKMLTDQPWTTGWLRMEPENLKKIDDLTVEITNSEPIRMPRAFTHIWHSIQHPDTPPGWGGTIGTGPYKLEELEQDQFARVSAFEDYWQGTPNIDELTFRTIEDQGTRDLALEGGEVDISFDLSPSRYEKLQESEDRTGSTHPLITAVGLVFNNTRTPTDDVDFRKALNYAVSQEMVIEGALNGIGDPARGPVPSYVWWSAHDSLPAYDLDKDRARDLLENSDYNGETVTLVASSSPHRVNGPTNPQVSAEIVQEAAAKIDVDIEIRMMEQAAYSEAEASGEGGHMFQGSTVVIAAKPGDMIETFSVEDGPFEYEEEVLERVESLKGEGIATENRDDAKSKLSEAQHILMEEQVIMIPLYYKHYVLGRQKSVEGGDYHPTMRHSRFEDLEINN